MADPHSFICATRAIKNAMYLQSVAPQLMPEVEPPEGFGSIIPLPVLATIHRPDAAARLSGPLANVKFPELRAAAAAPLFSGALFFVRIHFTVQNQNGAVVSVSASDISTALEYARRAVAPISLYASQYGPNSVVVNDNILSFAVTLQNNTYNNAQLQGWVNVIASQQKLPSNACLVVLNPLGIVNTSYPLSLGFNGVHLKANIAYIFVNMGGQNLAITDPPFFYAGSLSHEIAEMVVDPRADISNREVCDLCGPNCVSTYLDYFDATGTYITTSQQFPPNFSYSFYLNGIVRPAFATLPCDSTKIPANACSYAPSPLIGMDHFYTTSLLERDNAIDNDGYQSEGVACFVFAGATDGTVPLHRLFNAASGDHFYTTSDAERDNAINNDGYQREGEACLVYAQAKAPSITGFHRLFRPTGDHFYTTSDVERDNAIANSGYQSEGESSFVYAINPSNVGALYRLFRPTGDHFYTISLAERDNAIADGYRSEDVACFAYPSATVGTVPLHRLFNAASGDHFYTTSDAERDNAINNDGYQSEGEACFVFAGATAGTVPLHRLFNAASGDHFYTTSDVERDNAIANSGYQSEGEACFLYGGDPLGTTSLYRLFHPFSTFNA